MDGGDSCHGPRRLRFRKISSLPKTEMTGAVEVQEVGLIRFSGSELADSCPSRSPTTATHMTTGSKAELNHALPSLGKTEHNVPNVGRRRRPGGGQTAAVPRDVRSALQQCQVRKKPRKTPFNPVRPGFLEGVTRHSTTAKGGRTLPVVRF